MKDTLILLAEGYMLVPADKIVGSKRTTSVRKVSDKKEIVVDESRIIRSRKVSGVRHELYGRKEFHIETR